MYLSLYICIYIYTIICTHMFTRGETIMDPWHRFFARSDLVISALCALSQTQFLVGEKQVLGAAAGGIHGACLPPSPS